MLDTSGYDAYQTTSVNAKAAGANVHQLVLMLFQGFLEELQRAEGHIEQKRFDKKAASIEKLLKILGGLEASLDPENNEDVVKNMRGLYQFSGQALMRANLHNDASELIAVKKVMTDLKEGWEGILQNQ
ncbi:flagellar export chaperone FliS [Alteromonas sp. S015]|uniref:flagellar export chaperone FliS n=1 Tax=Alteromonas sp. S015 TaxID=3117401 RepID=UPI002FE049AD